MSTVEEQFTERMLRKLESFPDFQKLEVLLKRSGKTIERHECKVSKSDSVEKKRTKLLEIRDSASRLGRDVEIKLHPIR